VKNEKPQNEEQEVEALQKKDQDKFHSNKIEIKNNILNS